MLTPNLALRKKNFEKLIIFSQKNCRNLKWNFSIISISESMNEAHFCSKGTRDVEI